MTRNRLTLVTFNIWFGDYFQERRLRALLELVRATDPDIIGFQEVTPWTRKIMENEPWIADQYEISDVSVAPYGVLLLSRVPVKRFDVYSLPSDMGRQLLFAELDLGHGDTMAVATVHLESLQFADTRRRQLEHIFPVLDTYDNAVLMGDFNMCATWDENALLRTDYLDIWPHVHAGDPGWTEDTDINTMRLKVNAKPTQVRFDRVIVRSNRDCWHPTAIERLGTEPIDATLLPGVFPSDHFGLCARIEYRDPSVKS